MKPPFPHKPRPAQSARSAGPSSAALKRSPGKVGPATSVQKTFQSAFDLHQQGHHAAARALYEEVLALQPGHGDALHLSGVLAAETHQFPLAVSRMRAAAALMPENAQIHCNLGKALRAWGKIDEAISSFVEAARLQPDYVEAWINQGYIQSERRDFPKAIVAYERVLQLKPDQPFMRGALLHCQMQVCDWRGLQDWPELAEAILRGEPVVDPFAMAALTDDPALQLAVARTWVKYKYPEQLPKPVFAPRAPGGKIRLAYFSADFYNHATMHLMAELFEAHDRERFELIGFSFGPDKKDEMQARAKAAFDQFIDVRKLSDAQVAALSREMGVDIAVDIKGFTTHARAGIFAQHAAPLQVSYLGFPGTMGSDYFDYVLADATVVPRERSVDFTEQVVRLPHSYQPNNSERMISPHPFTRADVGLPPSGFVYCCFNNNFKILPETFDGWMRILHRVEGSVLWLIGDNPSAIASLRDAAGQRGIDPQRLVFAPRMVNPMHLARHRLADVFLDSLPYNAHTTASDALWAGLPVLTRMGRSFASRVAASMLNALGLTDLVTSSQERYEAVAAGLANDPDALPRLRTRLEKIRRDHPVFRGDVICRHLESAYTTMHERCMSGLPPAAFDVQPLPL